MPNGFATRPLIRRLPPPSTSLPTIATLSIPYLRPRNAHLAPRRLALVPDTFASDPHAPCELRTKHAASHE